MLTDQDIKIIHTLIREGDLTAYALAQKTNISIPQVQYRLNKLLDCEVVDIINGENKNYWSIHPIFHSKDSIDSLKEKIEEAINSIEPLQTTPLDGLKLIFSFLIDSLNEQKNGKNNSY